MAKKIYLSPSMQKNNAYAVGNTNEMVQANRIADATKIALERNGFEVKKAPQGQSMYTSIRESNNWMSDLHIPIHTNAFNGKTDGTLVMVYSTAQKNLDAAQPIYDNLYAVTPGRTVRGVQARPDLAELRDTNATAVYVEVDFHDNPPIAQWLIDNPQTVAEAIAKGVTEYYGIPYIGANNNGSESNENENSNVLYKVQVGAFSVKQNAENLASRLNKAGYDTYIALGKDMLYRVQTGAFRERTNAEDLVDRLKASGFDSFIVKS